MNRRASYPILMLFLILVCACGPEGNSRRPAPAQPIPTQEADQSPTVARPPYAELLWKTTLGQAYHELLFADYARELFPNRSERLALRVVSEPAKLAARVAALQIMNEDLYVREKMNDEIRSKIQLLEASIQKDREEAQRSAFKTVLSHIPYVLLASLPWGSPLIRNEITNFPKEWSQYIIARIQRKPAAPPQVQWKALFSKKVFEDYEVSRPASLFFQTVAPFSIIEFFLIQEVAGNLTGEASLEEMIAMADF